MWWDNANTVVGITIQDSTFKYNGGSGIKLNGDTFSGVSVTGNSVHDNCTNFLDSVGDLATDARRFSAGIYIFSTDQTGGAGTISGNTVYNNGVVGGRVWAYGANQGNGIWCDTTTTMVVTGNNVYGNVISGIYLEKTLASTVAYNLVYDNGAAVIANASHTYGFGSISLLAGSSGDVFECSDNKIYNNAVYGGWWGIGVKNFEGETEGINGNIIRNNIAIGAETYALYALSGGDNVAHGSGNIYDHNCFDVESANFILWTNAVSTYDAFIAASSQADNNVEADPLFVDPDNGDFTLKAESPCIDAGVDVGLPTDIAGNAVDNPPEIGAYQSLLTSTSVRRYRLWRRR
jgi:parallel beta-helix repeat protein